MMPHLLGGSQDRAIPPEHNRKVRINLRKIFGVREVFADHFNVLVDVGAKSSGFRDDLGLTIAGAQQDRSGGS
jgi:hypothetical protein